MKMTRLVPLVLFAALVLAACATTAPSQPATGSFQAVGPDVSAYIAPKAAPPADYHLGPLDKISVRVFQLEEMSFPELQLDANGQIVMPRIGTLAISGLTTTQVADAIKGKLSQCCLRDPEVIVGLREAVSQQVTVTGAVKQSGVISLRGRATLQSVVAMAGRPVMETADLKSVGIIRYTNGARTVGKFNLEDINRGVAADPEVLPGDVVVVDVSNSKSTFRTILQGLPLIGVFTLF